MTFNNKKLLILAHKYHSFVKDQVEALAAYSSEITVLVRYKPIAELATWLPIPALESHTKEAAIDLRNKPDNVRVIPSPVFYLPTDGEYKRLGERHFRAVQKVIVKENIQFDLIHAHFAWSAGFVGAKLKEIYGKPLIITGHGYDIYDLPFRDAKWRSLLQSVYNSADQIITVSESNRACLKRLGVAPPITVIPNGFRSDLFYPRDQRNCRRLLGLPVNKKIVLTVGNLVEVKGQEYLIEAMEQIRKSSDFLCIIVGSGELRRDLERQIEGSELRNNVRLVGGRPHHEIPLWMNAADYFVLPSLDEGNPTVMFESLACGTPLIATTVGGIPEIINCDNYGLLVEPANSRALADAIHVALDRTFDRETISIYATQYAYNVIVKDILDVLFDVN